MEKEKPENSINKAEVEKMKFTTNFKINYDKARDSQNIHLTVSTTKDTQSVIKEFCVEILDCVTYAFGMHQSKRYRVKEWLLNDLANSCKYGTRWGKDYLFDKEFIDTGKMEIQFTNIGDAISFITECKDRLDKCLTSIFTYKQLNVDISFTVVPLKTDEEKK